MAGTVKDAEDRSPRRRPPTKPVGLSTQEAAARLATAGRNVLPASRGPSVLRQLVAQLTHLLAALLWIAAALALLAGMPPIAIAIVSIILLNGGFAFWQEYRADKSVERLRDLLPHTTRVWRNAAPTTIDVEELVVGDLVELAAGDRVGADLDVVSSRELTLDESLLTGESEAVPHSVGDRLMAGTFVVQGEALAEVVATATATALAQITALTAHAERPASPLTRQLTGVVRVIAFMAVGTGVTLGLIALGLGLSTTEAFLFGVGVAVALVPEGLLPTVTLSLARGAQTMADRDALVRRLDAVETLGATTFICADKTGTLTQNRMNVVELETRFGAVHIDGDGYGPEAGVTGAPAACAEVGALARAAASCVTGRVVERDGRWYADGDPMEAALHCLLLRSGAEAVVETQRLPYSADRLLSSSLSGSDVAVLGAPEAVLRRCVDVPDLIHVRLHEMTGAGKRVLAVASRTWLADPSAEMEHDLGFLGLIGLEDPPREGVGAALQACREADIRVAMLTGDHPRTAEAIAREIGLLGPSGVVVEAADLPTHDAELADLLDREGGAVVARVSPSDKLRIARALRGHGHVVAMTGDGVNDAPALREADVGVAMGASGSDVAREAADLVLLDDHFATIVVAIELGRATFRNIRRFLTYHLTDNVAELTPFMLWALSAGDLPLAIGVLQVLALDIGTDMLPALALGAEPPRAGIMRGRHRTALVDRSLLVRAFGVLGPTEAVCSMSVFVAVLVTGGWAWGQTPGAGLLSAASGAAFAAIAVGQMANAFACRSTTRPIWRLSPTSNKLLLVAVGVEILLILGFLSFPFLTDLLGGSWPSGAGWLGAIAGGAVLIAVDGLSKHHASRNRA